MNRSVNDLTIAAADIREVRVSDKTVWRHVVLTSSGGLAGTGEFSFDGAPADMAARVAQVAGSLVGNAANRDCLAPHRELLPGGMAGATVYSALEQALAEIESRAVNLPLWRHMAQTETRSSVPLYANINRRTTDRTFEGFRASAAKAKARGFAAIKIAPFDGLSPPLCASDEGKALIEAGFCRIEGAAEGAGRDFPLMVDCHWRFDQATAMEIPERLARLSVIWYECPVPETEAAAPDIAEVRRAANAHGMRLAGLETTARWDGFRPFIEAGAYDVIMPDIKHAGGYAAIIEIAGNAADRGVATSLHNPSGPIAHMASVHLSAAIGGEERLEHQFDESPLFTQLTDMEPAFDSGSALVPATPGLGVKLRETLENELAEAGTAVR